MAVDTETRPQLDIEVEDVRDKSVLVTGGTTGIGRATALLLASKGARVATFGKDPATLQEATEEFRRFGADIYAVAADAWKPDDLQRVFGEVDSRFGKLDVLVNNAALPAKGIMDGTYGDWQYVVQTNLLGYMACARYAADRMKASGGGDIVFVGSMSAHVREKGSSVYVATKAGVEGFCEALRKEVNELGIRVSLIEPGAVGTNLRVDTREDEVRQEREHKMLMAEDVAQCVLYCLTQPRRVDVVEVRIKPRLQII
jgi:NADP-dependent 3-hydroxy acid dehydrogenase YdfG